jgi:hypothetical protein
VHGTCIHQLGTAFAPSRHNSRACPHPDPIKIKHCGKNSHKESPDKQGGNHFKTNQRHTNCGTKDTLECKHPGHANRKELLSAPTTIVVTLAELELLCLFSPMLQSVQGYCSCFYAHRPRSTYLPGIKQAEVTDSCAVHENRQRCCT